MTSYRQSGAPLVALLLIGCGAQTELKDAHYPLSEVRVAKDGSEAWCRLAAGATLAGMFDLEAVKGFSAGVTPTIANELYGTPARIEQAEGATKYTYVKGAKTVHLVKSIEKSSAAGTSITRYELRMPVDDPPFSQSLPAAVRELYASEQRRRSVTLVSEVREEPAVMLNIIDRRVDSLSFGWRPNPKASRP